MIILVMVTFELICEMSKSLGTFKAFKATVELQKDKLIEAIRSGESGE